MTNFKVKMTTQAKSGYMLLTPHKNSREGAEYMKAQLETQFSESVKSGNMTFEIVEVET